jgi:hypothetical protein
LKEIITNSLLFIVACRVRILRSLECQTVSASTPFASTRYGDDFDERTASFCVRRAVYWDPETRKEDPSNKGICSNFLCDSKPGDKVQITFHSQNSRSILRTVESM